MSKDMDFYSVWSEMRANGIEDNAAIISFLTGSESALAPLYNGTEQELEQVFTVLDSIPIEHFFDVIETLELERELVPADVPCFSNFENGASRLNELLEFEPDGLTFSDAGYQLMNSVKPGARVKYGENHSKLAAMMSLVTISNSRPAVVKATVWGEFLTRYDLKRKAGVLQKLLLRDLCVKTIVKSALQGPATYRDAVKALSLSTALRRRTNVKCLVEFVLSGTDREEVLSRIDWEMQVM